MPDFHETTVRVRYAETDQMGVVYHANYYVWFELGRTEMLRATGINYRNGIARRLLYRRGRIELPLPAAGALRRRAAHPHARHRG